MIYLAMPADYAIHKRANSGNTTYNSRHQNVLANEISDGPRLQDVEMRPAKPQLTNPAETDGSAANPDSVPRPVQTGKPNKTSSVQVSATTSKEIADNVAQQLKSEGYAVYVVQAEVKGQKYHRVRIGPFSAREEAESVRQLLARHETYRDAYVPND